MKFQVDSCDNLRPAFPSGGRRRPCEAPFVLKAVWALILMAVSTTGSLGQELEPRAYASSPVGFQTILCAYTFSAGGVVIDSSLPLEDVSADVNGATLGYFGTIGFLGRMANFSLAVPYTWGSLEGLLDGEFARATRSGLADPRFRFGVNLAGAPAMRAVDFLKRRQGTNLGASVTLSAPLGQYDPSKLINLGTNRWAVKPEVGVSHARGKWLLEGAAGTWLFAKNANFLGSVRTQDPLLSLQAHVSYQLPHRMWIAFNANYFAGGKTSLDGIPGSKALNNSRIGATFSFPLGKRHSIKLSYNGGIVTRIGSSLRSVAVAYQYRWIGGR